MVELAIVGGGPGGLMMAHLLERFPAGLFDVALFEATPRLGAKVLTQRFDTIPTIYEAGVAELTRAASAFSIADRIATAPAPPAK